ncbi:MAG: hypothetical protein ACLQT6_12805 [Desulfomonilaceae bacterium]
MNRKFQLRIIQLKDNEIAVSLTQIATENDTSKPTNLITVSGLPLKIMLETLLTALKKQGYRPTQFSSSRKEPFDLDEPAGVRLGLMFFALKPLKKPSRMEEIVSGITRMSDEETYYWFSKCAKKERYGRAKRALRLLLSDQ